MHKGIFLDWRANHHYEEGCSGTGGGQKLRIQGQGSRDKAEGRQQRHNARSKKREGSEETPEQKMIGVACKLACQGERVVDKL
mmetsp:Transcript_43537/g.93254  ORF Transcript_43537/g.93254 Transcript_43537/m.93254 type:complete len:83 (-) Transcript_43537:579-827(-)